MMLSQILVVAGLILEFLSVAVTVRKSFWGYYKRADESGKTDKQRGQSDRVEGIITLLLLSLGIILQGFAVFVD